MRWYAMLSKEAFMDAIFELADVWRADTSETTYRNLERRRVG